MHAQQIPGGAGGPPNLPIPLHPSLTGGPSSQLAALSNNNGHSNSSNYYSFLYFVDIFDYSMINYFRHSSTTISNAHKTRTDASQPS
jgi:hypothetical protein